MKLLLAAVFFLLITNNVFAKPEYKYAVTGTYAVKNMDVNNKAVQIVRSSSEMGGGGKLQQYRTKEFALGNLITIKTGEKVKVLGYVKDENQPTLLAKIEIKNKIYYMFSDYLSSSPLLFMAGDK